MQPSPEWCCCIDRGIAQNEAPVLGPGGSGCGLRKITPHYNIDNPLRLHYIIWELKRIFLHFMLYASLKGIKKGTLLKSNLTIRISECSNNNTKAKKFIIKYMFYRVGINPIVFVFSLFGDMSESDFICMPMLSTCIENPVKGSLKAPSHTFLFEYCHRKYRAFSS